MSAAIESSVGVMDCSLHNANRLASEKVSRIADALAWRVFHNANVPERPKNHLRAWREFRKMTQEQLADAVGTDKGVISLLESGARGLSDKWLFRLAPVLGTKPGTLLDHDPESLDNDVHEIFASVDEKDRETALRVLKSFRRTGTSNR